MMTDRIKLSLATFFAFVSFLIMFGFMLLVFDQLLHRKFDKIAGLNYKGYRGEIRKEKASDELRIAMFGGSPLWGYGVYYWEAIPHVLEKKLQHHVDSLGLNRRITVFNLGYNNEGIYAIYNNMQDFRFLDYDIAIIFTGYDDLGIGNTTNFRRENLFFKYFKYMPILPVYLSEKIMLLKSDGNLEDAYWGTNQKAQADVDHNLHVNALANILSVYNSTENVLKRIGKVQKQYLVDFDLKNDKWAWMKYYLRQSIDYSVEDGVQVLIITEPVFTEECLEQQKIMKAVVDEAVDESGMVHFIDLGSRIELNDDLLIDGVHFSTKGCKILADSMVNSILPWVELK